MSQLNFSVEFIFPGILHDRMVGELLDELEFSRELFGYLCHHGNRVALQLYIDIRPR